MLLGVIFAGKMIDRSALVMSDERSAEVLRDRERLGAAGLVSALTATELYET